MRELIFDVTGQRILQNKDCDFSGIVAGSEGYLKAKFNFLTDDWDGCKKVVAFYKMSFEYGEDGFDEHAVCLDADNACDIPVEVLKGDMFALKVVGVKAGYRIPTNIIKIKQEVM